MKIVAANAVFTETVFPHPKAFWRHLEQLLAPLKAQGAQVVLLPGLTGLVYTQAVLGPPPHPAELIQEAAAQAPHLTAGFSRLARQFRLYLCPGSTVVRAGGRYHLAAALFDPEGRQVGEQYQTHLSAEERSWGLSPGEELQVFPTAVGKLALVVGTDGRYPEVSRIVGLQGAELVLAPAAVPAPYNRWRQVASLWREVQQNQFFALENWLQGQIGATTYDGRAAILAPCEMAPGETGYLAEAQQSCWAELDFHRRQEVIAAYPLFKHLNPTLYEAHLPGIYERRDPGAS